MFSFAEVGSVLLGGEGYPPQMNMEADTARFSEDAGLLGFHATGSLLAYHENSGYCDTYWLLVYKTVRQTYPAMTDVSFGECDRGLNNYQYPIEVYHLRYPMRKLYQP